VQELFDKLEKAKANVRWLLDHSEGLVDMHGIAHWASEIERLRKEIKERL